MSRKLTDIADRLRFIAEAGQCDCHICETASLGAEEIEKLRSIGDAIAGAIRMGMWETLDFLLKDWNDARTQNPHKEGQ